MPDNPLGTMQPAQEPAKSTFDASAFIDPTNGLIFGKYDPGKPEEAAKGYWELTNYASQTKQEAERYRELLEQTIQQRVNPNDRTAMRQPEDDLRTSGIPVEPLLGMIRREAQAIAEAQFEPITRTMTARNEIASLHPEYPTEEGAIMAYVAKSPALSQKFNRMLAGGLAPEALDYARLAYKESLGAPRQGGPASPSVQAQMAAAQLPTNVTAEGGRSAAVPNADKRLEDALGYHKQSRDERPFIDAWFDGVPLTWTEKFMAQLAATQQQR